MKRIVSLILILIICLSISGCYRYDETYTEIWSCIDEFDVEGFDSEEFISNCQSDSSIEVDSLDWGDFREEFIQYVYQIIYGELKGVLICVCYDVNSAKEYFEIEKKNVSRIYEPYWSLVRINNIVFSSSSNKPKQRNNARNYERLRNRRFLYSQSS